jgi:hypothetical protein
MSQTAPRVGLLFSLWIAVFLALLCSTAARRAPPSAQSHPLPVPAKVLA